MTLKKYSYLLVHDNFLLMNVQAKNRSVHDLLLRMRFSEKIIDKMY